MSNDLYWTRLVWTGGRGVAKLDGTEIRLPAPPHLKAVEIDGLDYAPDVSCFQIMPRRSGWRDMTPDEIAECKALLQRLIHG